MKILKLHYTFFDLIGLFIFLGTPMVIVPLFGAYIMYTNDAPIILLLFALFIPVLFYLIVLSYWDLGVVKVHTDTQMVESNKLDDDYPVSEVQNIVLVRDYNLRVSANEGSTTLDSRDPFGRRMTSRKAVAYYMSTLKDYRKLTMQDIDFHGFELKIPKLDFTEQELQEKHRMEEKMMLLNHRVTKLFFPEWEIFLQLTNGDVVSLMQTQNDKGVMLNNYTEQVAELIGCDMIDATGVYPIFIPKGSTDVSIRKDRIDASRVDFETLNKLQEPLKVEKTSEGILVKSTMDKLESNDIIKIVVGAVGFILLVAASLLFFSFPFLVEDELTEIWLILLVSLLPSVFAIALLFISSLVFRWINNSYKQDVVYFASDQVYVQYYRLITRFHSKKVPISSIERIMVYRFSFQYGIEICTDTERLQFSKGLSLEYAKNLEQILLEKVLLS